MLGKFLLNKIFMPNKAKNKVTDEKSFIKSCRIAIYVFGIYYFLFGVELLFINYVPKSGCFTSMVPAIIFILLYKNCRKYLVSLKRVKKDI